jgi:peptidoglycan/xylan/chitin deacetylase (PgdA/CDA1 family)
MSAPNVKTFDAHRVVARRWLRFGTGVGVTALLVLAVASTPFDNFFSGGDSQPRSATGPSLAGDDHRPPSTVSRAKSKSVPPSATSTLPPATTTEAPTTTTVPLQKPGLGLLAQPVPTPVPLPMTSLAPVFSRIPTPNKVIFLGIDDGIVRDPAVLDLLKQANIPFTMFLVQAQAHAGAEYWKQAEALGGIVEAHTITHPDLTKVSAGQMQREICGTLDDYQNLFGRRPTLFRPPYGSYNQNVQAVAASCGFKAIVMWKASTNDGRFDLQEGPQLHPGDIVLMHWRTDLYQNLQKVFQTCREQGYTIARLEDYLQ